MFVTSFHRALLRAAMLSGLLLLGSTSPTAAVEPGPAAQESLRCEGIVDLPASQPSPEHTFVGWDFRWEVFSADPAVNEPFGITVGRDCTVYVASYSPLGGQIVRLNREGATTGTWGGPGKAVGEFERLEGVAVDAAGNVFAADSGNNRVQRFNGDGQVTGVWADQFACRAIAEVACFTLPQAQEFHGSLSVGVDGQGFLYVVDGMYGVKKFAPDGAFVTAWPVAQSGDAGISRTGDGIAIDAAGNVYVTDILNDWVEKYTSDGALLGRFEIKDETLTKLDSPNGVAVDLEGSIYVTDGDNQRIVVLSAASEPVGWAGRCTDEEVAAGPCLRHQSGEEAGEFSFPRHVTVNARRELYVADRFNNRIQVLKAYPIWAAPEEAGE